MTTRRERLEAKATKRDQWAASAERASEAHYNRSHAAIAGIEPGQPILVGHHSERRHRKALDRSWAAMGASVEASERAQHHARKADGLRRQLDNSIFSDDADAIEKLEAKIAEETAAAERCNAINRAWRKGGRELVAEKFGEGTAKVAERSAASYSWLRTKPFDATSNRAEARRCKLRIEEIKRRQAKSEQAEAAGGVAIAGCEHVSVTFAEKPDWEVRRDLKAAGFRWSGGSWWGYRSKLPESVSELVEEGAEATSAEPAEGQAAAE